jgi:hypothetical protein
LRPPVYCTSTVLEATVMYFTILTHAKSMYIRLNVTSGSVLNL